MSVQAAIELTPGRPILVAVDFSPASEAALLAGARRAEAAQAPLLIAHIVHECGDRPGFYRRQRKPDDVRPISDIAKDMFDEFMGRVIAGHPQWPALADAERLLMAGVVGKRIVELAELKGAQQILVGHSPSRSNRIKDALCGSVGAWLARHSNIPVSQVEVGSAEPEVVSTPQPQLSH